MKVFVVVVPQDYMSADVIGVYTKRKMAENAQKNVRSELREGTYVQIREIELEG